MSILMVKVQMFSGGLKAVSDQLDGCMVLAS